MAEHRQETATLGGGCFWCLEAVYKDLKGVERVVSGYAGGSVENPTYEQVCGGRTGHAEVVQITFDPEQTSYRELIDYFWKTHDVTDPRGVWPDFGRQYRSIILPHNEEQLAEARPADVARGDESPDDALDVRHLDVGDHARQLGVHRPVQRRRVVFEVRGDDGFMAIR